MYYVYLIQSLKNEYIYVGFTRDLKKRLDKHNKGLTESIKTWRPIKIIYYKAYIKKDDAIEREKYLKSGWGRNFVRRNLKHYFKTQDTNTNIRSMT
jgi:putative endonuclease